VTAPGVVTDVGSLPGVCARVCDDGGGSLCGVIAMVAGVRTILNVRQPVRGQIRGTDCTVITAGVVTDKAAIPGVRPFVHAERGSDGSIVFAAGVVTDIGSLPSVCAFVFCEGG